MCRDYMPGRRVLVCPCKGVLRGVAVSLPELWRSRKALNNIEGLDLSVANALLGVVGTSSPPLQSPSGETTGIGDSATDLAGSVSGGVPVLPYAVWQCGGGYREISQRFDLLHFDFSGPVADVEGAAAAATALPGGTCHAIVYWMDFHMDDAATCVVSGAPPQDSRPGPSEQAVQLLPQPIEFKAGAQLTVAARFLAADGNVEFEIGA